MNLQNAKVGDLVKVDKKGRVFYAEIREKRERELGIAPLDPKINYYTCTSREVKGLWLRSRQKPAPRKVQAVRQTVGHENL